MTYFEVTSEDDIWKLFGGREPETCGGKELVYEDVWNRTSVLDVSKGYRPKFKMEDTSRFYRLRCDNIEAVVNQACLHATAKKIGNPELRVTYVGTAPNGLPTSY